MLGGCELTLRSYLQYLPGVVNEKSTNLSGWHFTGVDAEDRKSESCACMHSDRFSSFFTLITPLWNLLVGCRSELGGGVKWIAGIDRVVFSGVKFTSRMDDAWLSSKSTSKTLELLEHLLSKSHAWISTWIHSRSTEAASAAARPAVCIKARARVLMHVCSITFYHALFRHVISVSTTCMKHAWVL